MYTINGTITLKISRKDLELIVNSLNVMIPIIKSRHENFSLYDTLLKELNNVERKWEEEEKKVIRNKKIK